MAVFNTYCDDAVLTLRGGEGMFIVRYNQPSDAEHRNLLRDAFVSLSWVEKRPLGVLFITATQARKTGDDASRKFLQDSIRDAHKFIAACAVVVEEHGVLASVRKMLARTLLLGFGAKHARVFDDVDSAALWLHTQMRAPGASPSVTVDAIVEATRPALEGRAGKKPTDGLASAVT